MVGIKNYICLPLNSKNGFEDSRSSHKIQSDFHCLDLHLPAILSHQFVLMNSKQQSLNASIKNDSLFVEFLSLKQFLHSIQCKVGGPNSVPKIQHVTKTPGMDSLSGNSMENYKRQYIAKMASDGRKTEGVAQILTGSASLHSAMVNLFEIRL